MTFGFAVAIFIHGCFWHGHKCKFDHQPKTNKEFWNSKIMNNKNRDIKTEIKLEKLNWKIIVIWECEILTNLKKSIEKTLLT